MADGVVVVGSDDGNIYARDALTGKKRRTYPTRREVFSSPSIVDGTVYIGAHTGFVYALDAASGTER